MQLSDEEQALVTKTTDALSVVNEGLKQMRSLKIACNLEEHEGRYYLNAKAIIMGKHYKTHKGKQDA